MGSADCQSKNEDGFCTQKAEYECDFNVAGQDNGTNGKYYLLKFLLIFFYI